MNIEDKPAVVVDTEYLRKHCFQVYRVVVETEEVDIAREPPGIIGLLGDQHAAFQHETVAVLGMRSPINEAFKPKSDENDFDRAVVTACEIRKPLFDGGGDVFGRFSHTQTKLRDRARS